MSRSRKHIALNENQSRRLLEIIEQIESLAEEGSRIVFDTDLSGIPIPVNGFSGCYTGCYRRMAPLDSTLIIESNATDIDRAKERFHDRCCFEAQSVRK